MKKLKITQQESDLLSGSEQQAVCGMGSCAGPMNFCFLFDNGCTDSAANNPPYDRSAPPPRPPNPPGQACFCMSDRLPDEVGGTEAAYRSPNHGL